MKSLYRGNCLTGAFCARDHHQWLIDGSFNVFLCNDMSANVKGFFNKYGILPDSIVSIAFREE